MQLYKHLIGIHIANACFNVMNTQQLEDLTVMKNLSPALPSRIRRSCRCRPDRMRIKHP
ncbi:hypothetical protein U6Y25_03575 [Cutibacterium acnes]|nr:hypothetical protein [Cutibacterium acnes]